MYECVIIYCDVRYIYNNSDYVNCAHLFVVDEYLRIAESSYNYTIEQVCT